MWFVKVDGETLTPFVIAIVGQLLYYAIDKNSQSTKRLNEGQDESDSQVDIAERVTDSIPKTNQLVPFQGNNNSDEGFNSDDSENGTTNYYTTGDGIHNVQTKYNNSATGYKSKVYGIFYKTVNQNFFNGPPPETLMLGNGRRRSYSETINHLQITLNSAYKKNFNKIFMFETDEDFSFHLEKVFIKPVILQTKISSDYDSNGQKRFLLEADYGMGKRTWSRYMALQITGKGICPYFETTGYRLLVLCDVTNLIKELKNSESFENILITYIHKNNKDFKDLDDTEQLIRQYGDRVICIINGYEFIDDEKLQEKIKHFFKRGFENPSAFKSAFIVFSHSECGEKCSEKFLNNFDSKLTLQGIPKREYRNLIKKTFEINDERINTFEIRLRKFGLEFVKEMSPRMYIVSYYIYQKYNPETTREFLEKMLIFEGVEFLKQSKRTETREVLEREVRFVFFRNARVLWNKGKLHTYNNTIFKHKDFKKDDLRMFRYLGLLLSNDGEAYQVNHQLIYQFFVVYYLSEELALKSLEDQIKEFDRWSNSKINVVTGYSKGEYFMNCIYRSPPNSLFTLVLYRMDDSFQVDYYIHRDFQKNIAKICESHFTIDIVCVEKSVGFKVPTIVPIKFENDSYVKDLTENQTEDLRISITYPRKQGQKCQRTRLDSELSSNCYSYAYHVRINGVTSEIVYRVNLLQGDIVSLTQFVSGIYVMLHKWKTNVNFSISEQHLRLVFDNLTFANKVVNIGFGTEISEEGSTDLLEAVNDWRIHFVNNCAAYNWLISINQAVVARSGQEALNLDSIELNGLTDLSIILKFH